MLEGMVTESELLKMMELKPSELRYLRQEKGMPFVRLSSRRRVYLEKDLMDWFQANRAIPLLDSSGVTRTSPEDTQTHPLGDGADSLESPNKALKLKGIPTSEDPADDTDRKSEGSNKRIRRK